MIENESMLDRYLEKHFPNFNPEDRKFQNYYRIADSILDYTNFLLFPTEEVKSINDGKIINRTFKCDLIVEDDEFGDGEENHQIEIDWKDLQSFDGFKEYVSLQVPSVKFHNLNGKMNKDEFCTNIQRGLLEGFKIVFGCKTSHKLNRIGFRGKNNEEFVFNNGILNIQSGEFTPGEYKLNQNTSINISFPLEQIENLTLEESVMGILSIKKYISKNNSVSSVVLGYLVAGVFRNECKAVKNEFPFLGIQAITNAGKTSLLNFLSWVCGFDADNILGTNDSEYAFEVGMNCLSAWFYYFDEIQKASSKLLKYVQAAYNSGENHKGGGNGNWQEIQTYRKNCNLICCGENLPNEEEALLNRFIIVDEKEPFPINKQITDEEEFKKYKALTGEVVNTEYLGTNQIKILAKEYYRPRFLNILRNKRKIDFEKYYIGASKIVETVAKELGNMAPESRILNNLSTAIAGYMAIYGDNVDEAEIVSIVSEYFINYLDYKRDAYIRWRAVNYMKDNIGDFCSWIDKVKGNRKNCPMVYIKHTQREQGLGIQIPTLSHNIKVSLGSPLTLKHIEQQLRGGFDVPNEVNKSMDIARGLSKMQAVFIDFRKVKNNELLKELWDVTLNFLGEHIEELKKIRDDGTIRYAMPDKVLNKLIEEMEETYSSAEFFDTASFSKENMEVKEGF